MTYDEFISVISSDVGRILQENSINITESLIANLPKDTPCLSSEQLELCRNAVNISVQLSVRIIFDYLDSLGMLNYPNLSEHFERPSLRVIHGGLSDKDKD